MQGLTGWLRGKESTCQCRRPGFHPWVRKSHWKRKWQPTPVFLPGKSHGQRSLVGSRSGVTKTCTQLSICTQYMYVNIFLFLKNDFFT